MNDRTWATLKIFVKGSLITSFLWPTGSEWHCPFCERQSYHITPCGQQQVSDSAHFVKGSLITSLHMTNSEWVALHILWRAVSSHHFLWPTGCKSHCTFCERQSHHIFSHHQQRVSNIAPLWKAISSHLFLWPTAGQWYSTFCERRPHHIISYNQQGVSDVAHFAKQSHHMFYSITNR